MLITVCNTEQGTLEMGGFAGNFFSRLGVVVVSGVEVLRICTGNSKQFCQMYSFGSHPQSNLNGSVGSLMEKLGNSFLNPEYEKILRKRFLVG